MRFFLSFLEYRPQMLPEHNVLFPISLSFLGLGDQRWAHCSRTQCVFPISLSFLGLGDQSFLE